MDGVDQDLLRTGLQRYLGTLNPLPLFNMPKFPYSDFQIKEVVQAEKHTRDWERK